MKRDPRFSGLRRAFSRPPSTNSLGRDVDDEIRFHIESHIADLVARGVSPNTARELAMQQYGDIGESRRELARVDRARLSKMQWSSLVDALGQDTGFAFRVFRTRPAFAFAVAIVLALGIGANSTMFGVIDRLLLRPPPHVADPANVMMIRYQRAFSGELDLQDALSFPMYLDLVNTPGAFKDVTAYAGASLTIGRGASARPVAANRVTASYFRTLGVRPRLGRRTKTARLPRRTSSFCPIRIGFVNSTRVIAFSDRCSRSATRSSRSLASPRRDSPVWAMMIRSTSGFR